jgi:hypothetical protein
MDGKICNGCGADCGNKYTVDYGWRLCADCADDLDERPDERPVNKHDHDESVDDTCDRCGNHRAPTYVVEGDASCASCYHEYMSEGQSEDSKNMENCSSCGYSCKKTYWSKDSPYCEDCYEDLKERRNPDWKEWDLPTWQNKYVDGAISLATLEAGVCWYFENVWDWETKQESEYEVTQHEIVGELTEGLK